jgi:hypothetical protein
LVCTLDNSCSSGYLPEGWGFPNFHHLAYIKERILDLRWKMGSCGVESLTWRRASTSSHAWRTRPSTLWPLPRPSWWISFDCCPTVLGGACLGALRGVGVGGIRNRAFAHPKNRERPCEGCRQQNPRSSGSHFHPPGVAFWQAPFIDTEAINTNPT